jgi:hypothetical protein
MKGGKVYVNILDKCKEYLYVAVDLVCSVMIGILLYVGQPLKLHRM